MALLLSLPLSAAGMLLAHQLTWSVAAHEHEGDVSHGYLQYAAIFLALAAAVFMVAATRQFVQTVGSGGVADAPSPWMFAVIPVVGFVLQEDLEHLVAARELDVGFFLTPPFLVGLVLQLPFAVAAMVIARLILGVIRTVATVVREAATPRWLKPTVASSAPIPLLVHVPRRRRLVYACAGRAPPAFH